MEPSPTVPAVIAIATAVVLAAGCSEAATTDVRRIAAEVAAAAQQGGAVRVIVRVDQPAGTPLATVQDAVLAELAGTSVRVLHRYLNSPFLALEVGADALRVLDRSAHVLSVVADITAHPQAPGPQR